jgi:hypothetical protein
MKVTATTVETESMISRSAADLRVNTMWFKPTPAKTVRGMIVHWRKRR